MNQADRQNILKKHAIGRDDIFTFRWRVPQVLCEAPKEWGSLTEIELLIRSTLNAYKNTELQQDFLQGKENIYSVLMEQIMEDLVKRGVAVRDDERIPFGKINMNKYRRGAALTDNNCEKV
jgi:hypothetical protein